MTDTAIIEAAERECISPHELEEAERKHHLIVFVLSPRSPHAKRFEWDKHLLVGTAAAEAAQAFGYKGGKPGLQTETKPPRTLDNAKTLEHEHVVSGQYLELVDTGGGV